MPYVLDVDAPTIFSALIAFYADKLGGTPGVDLFGGNSIDLPNEDYPMLTIISYGGGGPEDTQQEPNAIRHPNFQLTGRSIIYDEALALAEAALAKSTARNEVFSGFFFLRIAPRSDVFDLPLDPSGRSRVAFNIETTVRKVGS